MSPFLHERIVLRPTNTPSPIRMPRFDSPFASSRQLSSITTLLPMWILCGCRRTTFWPKTTLRPHDPSSHGYDSLPQRQSERSRTRLREGDDELVLEQRAETRPADDQRRVLLARGLAGLEQLVLSLVAPWRHERPDSCFPPKSTTTVDTEKDGGHGSNLVHGQATHSILSSAYRVHSKLGPGLLERSIGSACVMSFIDSI